MNQYVVGDYVLLNDKMMNLKKNKLSPTYSGPYIIKSIYKADIEIQHTAYNISAFATSSLIFIHAT